MQQRNNLVDPTRRAGDARIPFILLSMAVVWPVRRHAALPTDQQHRIASERHGKSGPLQHVRKLLWQSRAAIVALLRKPLRQIDSDSIALEQAFRFKNYSREALSFCPWRGRAASTPKVRSPVPLASLGSAGRPVEPTALFLGFELPAPVGFRLRRSIWEIEKIMATEGRGASILGAGCDIISPAASEIAVHVRQSPKGTHEVARRLGIRPIVPLRSHSSPRTPAKGPKRREL